MTQYEIIPKDTMDAIEESIQRKRGSQTPIEPSEMPSAIDTIPSSVDGTDVPVGGIYFTKPDSNGNPTECYIVGYAPLVTQSWEKNMVNVQAFPKLEKILFLETENIISIGAGAFEGALLLREIQPPSELQIIFERAFHSCVSLCEMQIPSSVSRIEYRAFQGCTALSKLYLPNSLQYVERGSAASFLLCSSLEDVTLENGFNCSIDLSSSNKYTAETIVSWLEALADRTGQVTLTLTIGSANLNKLTAEQKAIATNKNWTLS